MDKIRDKIGRVLIIAGSDCSGGAGIQADIKTCAAFGVYSASVITAITAQNTLGVQRTQAVSVDMVRAQISSILSDIGADVIKIGMLANGEIIDCVADMIARDAEDIPVVLDPVLVATSGDRLLDESAIASLKEKLIPLADIITPNIPEAEALTGLSIKDVDGMIKAGEALLEMGAYAALMKGGHLEGKSVIDVLVNEQGNQIMSAPRIHSRHTHGTGCTLASAIAAGLALGMPTEIAVSESREFVFEAIKMAPGLGAGNGPLGHGLRSADTGEPQGDNPFAALKDL